MAGEKPRLPKGTRDFGPLQMAKRNYIIDIIKHTFRTYGFHQIETPALENLDVLTGKYGDEGDQLLFKVLNSGDFLTRSTEQDFKQGAQKLAPKIAGKGLKYDLTVPFARFVVMNRDSITFPFKRFQVQPVWRADRPQKGRYREFYQCDADIIGSSSLVQEAEIIQLIEGVYSYLGFKDYVIKFNNRKILTGISQVIGMEGKESDFCVAIDKLDKKGEQEVLAELKGKGCPEDSFKELSKLFSMKSTEQLAYLKTFLASTSIGMEGVAEITRVFNILKETDRSDSKLEFDTTLARGLTYYTGAIYEVKPTSVKIGSITAGGRYDDLTGVFGWENVSGIGISFGVDRIYDVLEELNLFPESLGSSTQIMIASFDQKCLMHSFRIVSQLRNADIKADLYPEAAKMKKQFNYADKNNIPYVLIVGPDEMVNKSYSLKNMATGEQQTLGINEIINLLKR